MSNEVMEMTSIAAAFADETSVDQTIPIRNRFQRITAGLPSVTDAGFVDAAKEARTALNALEDDAKASRMRIMRAIKKHPIGQFAFTKSDLEKAIKAASDGLKTQIDAHEKSEAAAKLGEERQTFECFVTGTLAEVNKLAVAANDIGLGFENHGPVALRGVGDIEA